MAKHFMFVSNHAPELINDAVLLEAECSKVADKSFCTNMGVTGFPTVMLVYQGKAMKYQGSRTHAAMTTFLGDKSKWVLEDLPPKMAAFLPAT
jgi:hypothetical protein